MVQGVKDVKKTICILAVLIASVIGSAQARVYKNVPYGDNPFMFCKLGMPAHGWVSDGDGQWHKIVKRPNRYWIATFEEVCNISNGRDITPDQPPVESTKDPAFVP